MQSWTPATRPPTERRDAWVEAITRTHLPWALDTRDGLLAVDAVVRRHLLGDVALVDCVAGAGSGARSRRQIAATDGEYVGLLLVRSGYEHLELGERRVTVGPGEAILWDSRVPTRFRVPERLVKRTLLVPRDRLTTLAEPGPDGFAGRRLAPGAPSAVLAGYLDTVAEVAADLPPAAARAAGAAAIELLVAALTADDADRAPSAALWDAVRDLVEDRLADPGLDPRAIAAASAVSLRALYTVFERHGETVAGYLRRRRLARAHADLVRFGRRTTVAAVAVRWGFRDAGTFTRAYRRHYGRPPSRTMGEG